MKRRLLPAPDRPRRTRNPRRAILTAIGVTLAIAAVPASASAAVRTLSIQDPQGDASALSGAVLDLKALDVRYDDDAGTLRVVWTYYNDVRADPNAWVGGMLSLNSPLRPYVPNDSVSVSWSGGARYVDGSSSWGASADLWLSGASGSLPGTVTVSENGHAVTAEFSHTMLADHDWRYTWGGSVTNGDGFGDSTGKYWFDGYSEPNPPLYPPGGPMPPGSSGGGGITPPGGGAGGGPVGNQGMTINGGALYTNDPDVTLSINAPHGVESLRVSNDGGFGGAKTFPVKSTIRWHLAETGPERLPKTVYLRFGNDAQTFTDDIILDQTNPTISSATTEAPGAAPRTAAVAQVAATHGRTYQVRVRAKDATSGVAKVQFAARSRRHPSAPRKFTRISTYKGTRAPKYVRVQDRAGNYSRWRSIR